MKLAALVKLGAYYGLLNISDRARLEKLVTDVQPANLIALCAKKLDADERDVYRAEYASKVLKSIVTR